MNKDDRGYFGPYGGQYVPETVMPALAELEASYARLAPDTAFQEELGRLYRDYAGRPTPLYCAERLSDAAGGARDRKSTRLNSSH